MQKNELRQHDATYWLFGSDNYDASDHLGCPSMKLTLG